MQLSSVIGIGWLMFFAYWWISAIGVKKNIRRRSLRWEVGIRLVAVVAIILLARLPRARSFFQRPSPIPVSSITGAAGLILCLAGFSLAVWARVHLGRNWGMPMSLKEGHELVTTGPYRYVRHPIYSGMLLAILGSALATGRVWLVLFVAMAIYCVYSARTEEGLMLQQFPEEYTRYKKRTKAIIPFVY
jgi:protein-S-isoprenylcysteine O-methyltransferase Ste14